MALSKHEITRFLAQEFPQALEKTSIEEISLKGHSYFIKSIRTIYVQVKLYQVQP